MRCISLVAACLILTAPSLARPAPGFAGAAEDVPSCNELLAQPRELPSPAGPLAESELALCDEQDLYYGFTQAANPAAALQCGWFQRANSQPTMGNPFYGPGVLSMLYANGIGVSRNLDLAMRFTCENTWAAPAEIEYRLQHLAQMRSVKGMEESFDLCDEVTSGLMSGACAGVKSKREDSQRRNQLIVIQAQWSPAVRQAYVKLAQASDAFIDARAAREIDMTGSARTMFYIEERDRLREQHLINLRDFARGSIPQASAAKLAADDQELNAVFQQLNDAPADTWQGTVKLDGIRETERAWIALRDAWTTFGRIAYPNLAAARIQSRLTRQRIHQLRDWLPKSSASNGLAP